MFYYTAFGFNIASEIEFPELFISEAGIVPDINIKLGTAPGSIPEGITENPVLFITPYSYLINFEKTAAYYAEKGNLIIADLYPGADLKLVRLYLLCNAMPAIIHQRKLIPLHASGIITTTGVALIVGHSGAGKSTTLKALTQKGYRIFTDDVCVLKEENDKILAIPSYPMMKLWEQSFDLLQLYDKNDSHRLYDEYEKYGIFFHNRFITKWQPVLKIFNVEKTEDINEVHIQKQINTESFKIIGENTYRNHYIEPMKLNTLHFKIVSHLADQCEIFKISRPAIGDSISAVTNMIEREL